MAAWDPAQYLRWSDHRVRPAVDLIQRVPLPQPGHIVDLGCGTGNVTALLRGAWPAARVTGVDASAAMLARARASDPAVDWQQAEIGGWTPSRPVDLLFSNAALHWLDGHDTLFPRLLGLVAPGGALAVQMPRNFGEPSHTSITELAREARWKGRLAPLIRAEPCKAPAHYFDLLAPRAESLDIWETVYEQPLTGDNPVADFVKGSWLKPFLDALDDAGERAAFEAAYREKVARAYPPRADGITLFPFRRLFIVARC
ncbi:MAG TPA: methyltransferase domain-containing protein [Methylomirabilota bacterium]